MFKFVSQNKYLDFQDVLIQPTSSTLNSRSQVDLNRKIIFHNKNITFNGIPIVAANMTTTGTFSVYKTLSKYKILTALHKFYTLKDYTEFIQNTNNESIKNNKEIDNGLNPDYFIVSTGISDNDYTNLVNILDNITCKYILIDIANGYIENFKQFCRKVREKYPCKVIIAGNVCTKEGVKELIDIGIDIIKVGIGGGSACTTRIQTGVGMPQLSCILECCEFAKKYSTNSYIMSDGGITCPGNLAKAYGAGADFVMIGGEFSGHDENPGEIVQKEDGKSYKFFYGMSSQYAMKNNYSANNNLHYRTSEGREISVLYKGPLENTIKNYLGGLRSTCTYVNAKDIYQLQQNVKFYIVNNQANLHFMK